MKHTIEVLKQEGIIAKIQKNFDKVKPHKGVTEETILNSIDFIFTMEQSRNDKIRDLIFEALQKDAVEAIRKELNIEFVEEDEFYANSRKILHEAIEIIFGKVEF